MLSPLGTNGRVLLEPIVLPTKMVLHVRRSEGLRQIRSVNGPVRHHADLEVCEFLVMPCSKNARHCWHCMTHSLSGPPLKHISSMVSGDSDLPLLPSAKTFAVRNVASNLAILLLGINFPIIVRLVPLTGLPLPA